METEHNLSFDSLNENKPEESIKIWHLKSKQLQQWKEKELKALQKEIEKNLDQREKNKKLWQAAINKKSLEYKKQLVEDIVSPNLFEIKFTENIRIKELKGKQQSIIETLENYKDTTIPEAYYKTLESFISRLEIAEDFSDISLFVKSSKLKKEREDYINELNVLNSKKATTEAIYDIARAFLPQSFVRINTEHINSFLDLIKEEKYISAYYLYIVIFYSTHDLLSDFYSDLSIEKNVSWEEIKNILGILFQNKINATNINAIQAFLKTVKKDILYLTEDKSFLYFDFQALSNVLLQSFPSSAQLDDDTNGSRLVLEEFNSNFLFDIWIKTIKFFVELYPDELIKISERPSPDKIKITILGKIKPYMFDLFIRPDNKTHIENNLQLFQLELLKHFSDKDANMILTEVCYQLSAMDNFSIDNYLFLKECILLDDEIRRLEALPLTPAYEQYEKLKKSNKQDLIKKIDFQKREQRLDSYHTSQSIANNAQSSYVPEDYLKIVHTTEKLENESSELLSILKEKLGIIDITKVDTLGTLKLTSMKESQDILVDEDADVSDKISYDYFFSKENQTYRIKAINANIKKILDNEARIVFALGKPFPYKNFSHINFGPKGRMKRNIVNQKDINDIQEEYYNRPDFENYYRDRQFEENCQSKKDPLWEDQDDISIFNSDDYYIISKNLVNRDKIFGYQLTITDKKQKQTSQVFILVIPIQDYTATVIDHKDIGLVVDSILTFPGEIVVHCKSGLGRTGMFVAGTHQLTRIPLSLDDKTAIKELRKVRPLMQTVEQIVTARIWQSTIQIYLMNKLKFIKENFQDVKLTVLACYMLARRDRLRFHEQAIKLSDIEFNQLFLFRDYFRKAVMHLQTILYQEGIFSSPNAIFIIVDKFLNKIKQPHLVASKSTILLQIISKSFIKTVEIRDTPKESETMRSSIPPISSNDKIENDQKTQTLNVIPPLVNTQISGNDPKPLEMQQLSWRKILTGNYYIKIPTHSDPKRYNKYKKDNDYKIVSTIQNSVALLVESMVDLDEINYDITKSVNKFDEIIKIFNEILDIVYPNKKSLINGEDFSKFFTELEDVIETIKNFQSNLYSIQAITNHKDVTSLFANKENKNKNENGNENKFEAEESLLM